MMQVYKVLATGLGIGYIGRGGGSVASAVCCFIWYLLFSDGYNGYVIAMALVALTAIGIWVSNEVETDWGVDSSRVVIDEIAGMGITLFFIPVTVPFIATGFVLFRFFDIVKPLMIRKLEALPGGWGVMFDDVVAGIYSNILLHAILYFGWYGL